MTDVAGTDGTEALDLRILTPGLSDEEIAAVTSVVATMLEAQRGEAARDSAPGRDRWRHGLDPLGAAQRAPADWRSSVG